MLHQFMIFASSLKDQGYYKDLMIDKEIYTSKNMILT